MGPNIVQRNPNDFYITNRLMNELTIRPFQPHDQEAARRLILEGLRQHWGFLDESKNPDLDDIAASYAGGVFLVAYLGGELVGTGALLPEEGPRGEPAARLVRMSVAAHYRRQGIGGRILQALLEQARARGYRRVFLETTATWDDATAFYRAHGFRPLGIRDGDMHFVRELLPGAGGTE